jgi:hypothetical protein
VSMSKSFLKLIKGEKPKDHTQEVPPIDPRVEIVAMALLRYWFPKKMPTDIERWAEIAYNDSETAIKALIKKGYLK